MSPGFCAGTSRLLPHPPSSASIAAMALAGGVYLDKRFALIVPLIALVVCDVVNPIPIFATTFSRLILAQIFSTFVL